MGMTETEMIGVIVLACLVTAVIVRLLVGFAQRGNGSEGLWGFRSVSGYRNCPDDGE